MGKSIAKGRKNMPVSPRKKVAIITKIAADNGVTIKKNKLYKNELKDKVKKSVLEFYENDDISSLRKKTLRLSI